MRKLIFLCLAALVLCAVPTFGQQTPVSATVTDPNGVPYNFATGYASIACPGNQQPTFNGSPLTRTITITGFDGFGHFSMVLWDVNAIQPTTCGWQFMITWQDQITSFTTGIIGASNQVPAITGSTNVDLSAAISAFAPPLPTSGGGGGGVGLPNTTLAFSATPAFNANTNHSYTMTLTGNVTSSTVTGSPGNGRLLSLTMNEDATGGRTFVFPSGFTIPTNCAFVTTPNYINSFTFKFDGTNWNVINGCGPTLSAAGETLYVSANGNDSNSGLNWQSAKLTLCSAVRAAYDNGFAAAQFIIAPGNTGGVQSGSAVVNGQLFGCNLVQGQDANFLTVSSITRASNVVTLTTNRPVPADTWWVTGRKLSLMGGCPSKTFNGDFTIASVSGSTITWNQTGPNETAACGTILPFGFVPAPPNSSKFLGQGTAPVRLSGGQNGNSPIAITSISESGNIATVQTGTNHNMAVGQMVRITDVPEDAAPLTPAWTVAGTNVYNGMFIIQTVPDATHFTYSLAVVTGAATHTTGFATLETPTMWWAGGQHAQFNNIEFGPNALPFVAGWSTDWMNQGGEGLVGLQAPPVSDFYFEHCNFSVDTGTTVEGPAEWIGPNVLWYRHKHTIHNVNPTANVTSDQRAAMLEDTGAGGSATGIIMYDGEQMNGGGFRIRGSGSSTSVVVNDFLQEGTGQTPPDIDLLPQAVPTAPAAVSGSSTNVSLYFPGISDSGDSPPEIRVSPVYGPQNMSVYCAPALTATMIIQGPARVFGCETTSTSLGFISGGEPTNPASRRQHGEFVAHANLQVDDLRRSLSPVNVRFANSAAQSPASWTNAFGTGIAVASGMGPGDAPGTSNPNAGYLSCSANAGDPVSGTSYCAVRAFSASHTFNFGDYLYAGVWAKPTDASTAFTFGLGGGASWPPMSVYGPTFAGTYIFDVSSEGSGSGGGTTRFNAAQYTRNDGNWQWVWFWWKCTTVGGCGTATTNMQLNFSATNPWAFAYPTLVFVSGSQIAPPPAPTVSQVAGGSLAQRTYLVFSTYVNARGETTLSARSTITVSANNLLQITSPGASGGATGWNAYVYNQAGLSVAATLCQFGEFCPTRQNATPINIGTNFTEPTSGLVGTQPGGSPFAYDGARTGNNRTAPPVDTTNAVGDSEFADWADTSATYSNTCSVGTICSVPGIPTALTSPIISGTPTGTALQGTDTKLLTSGTVTGTGTTLCTDANGGATTSACITSTAIQSQSFTTLGGNVSVGNTATTITSLALTMPASGCPCRVRIDYGLYLTFPNTNVSAWAFWVNDGTAGSTHTLASLQTDQSNGATGARTSANAGAFTQLTYSNNAAVTFTLFGQGTGATTMTVEAAPQVGSGTNSWMSAVIQTSN